MDASGVLDVVEASAAFGPKSGHLFLREIAVGRSGNRADAIALQTYGSRGVHLHGLEVKVDRRDWLRELADARKADEIARYCQHWSVVAPEGLIDPEEVPLPWGLFTVRKADSKLFRAKVPPVLGAEPLTLDTIVRIVRRVEDGQRRPVDAALEAARERGYKQGREENDRAERWDRSEYDRLKRSVETFERVAGVRITDPWTSGDIGLAVRLLREDASVRNRIRGSLQSLADDIARIIDDHGRSEMREARDRHAALGRAQALAVADVEA